MAIESVYIYRHLLYVYNSFSHGATARVQDRNLTSYMDAAFVLLVHVGLETWTSQLLYFTQVGLIQLSSNVIRLCVASVSAEI